MKTYLLEDDPLDGGNSFVRDTSGGQVGRVFLNPNGEPSKPWDGVVNMDDDTEQPVGEERYATREEAGRAVFMAYLRLSEEGA